jgi:hypothetical protein
MSLRDNIFQKFGPLLQEALLEMWLEELNELRVALGKQPLTKDYILGKCNNNLNHLDDYDWMKNV